jgi:hypothetical protein
MVQPMPKKTLKRDDAAQSKAFIEKAHEIEADEEKTAADELIERLARTPPDPRSKKEKSGKR